MAAKLCAVLAILAAARASGTSCGVPKPGMHTAFAALPATKKYKDHDARSCHAWALPLIAVHGQAARARRHALAPCMSEERGDGAPDSPKPFVSRPFISRKLTDVLLDGSVQTPDTQTELPASSAVRPSKRAMVRKTATRFISFLFGRSERAPMAGAGTEGGGMTEMWPETSGAPLTASNNMPRMQKPEAQTESDRVFDLLNKYSQRHSSVNGTANKWATTTVLQKSKYANLYNPKQEDVKTSQSGKVLQKSKYADVWAAQDGVTTNPVTKPGTGTKPVTGKLTKSKYADVWSAQDEARADGSMQRSVTKPGTPTKPVTGKLTKSKYADVWSAQDEARTDGKAQRSSIKPVAKPAAGTKPVTARPGYYAKPSPGYYAKPLPSGASQGAQPDVGKSRLDQLMNSYSNRYPTDARYTPQEESQLLRRGTSPKAATSKTSSSFKTPESARAAESQKSVQEISSEEQSTTQDEEEATAPTDDITHGQSAGGTSLSAGTSSSAAIAYDVETTSNAMKRLSRMQLRRKASGAMSASRFLDGGTGISVFFLWIWTWMLTIAEVFAEKRQD